MRTYYRPGILNKIGTKPGLYMVSEIRSKKILLPPLFESSPRPDERIGSLRSQCSPFSEKGLHGISGPGTECPPPASFYNLVSKGSNSDLPFQLK
jgi:hypothetical protein